MTEAKPGKSAGDARDDVGTGATAAAEAPPSEGPTSEGAAKEPAKKPADEPARKPADEPARMPADKSAKGSARAGRTSRTADKDADRSGAKGVDAKGSVDAVRSTVATVVWVAAVLCALVLAAGALVVALNFNEQNGVVQFLTETAEKINVLGEMKTFEPDGRGADAAQSARTKEVLVNWGICAVAYLVVGKVLDRLIRP